HLDDAESALDRAVGELDLEGVPGRAHRRQVEPLEHLVAEALEPARQIADGQAEYGSGVETAAFREQLAGDAPVHRAAALDITAAEDEVGLARSREQRRQPRRIVGEVRV